MGIDKKAIAAAAFRQDTDAPSVALLAREMARQSVTIETGTITMRPRCDVKVSARIRPALDEKIRAFATAEGLTYSKALATLVARGLTR